MKLFALSGTTDEVFRYSLPTPYTLSGITYDNNSTDVTACLPNNAIGLHFKVPGGEKMYISSTSGTAAVHQLSLT